MTGTSLRWALPKPDDTDPLSDVAKWTRDVVDDVDLLGLRCKLFSTAGTLIPAGSATPITFDSEDVDTDGLHGPTNPSRITVTTAGRYRVVGQISFPANNSGRRAPAIRVNGATSYGNNVVNAVSGGKTIVQVGCTVLLAAGDYVELTAFQNSGGDITVDAGIGDTWLDLEWTGVQ